MPLALKPPPITLGEGKSGEAVIGTGESVPSGVDGIITYNELTMNNRQWVDTIIIEKIDGMGDPDVRDERENNPQEDGETPFDSFYGGRTLVLSGYIRAFSLEKCNDLKTALKSAFLTLEEKAMVFHGKDFDSTSQIFCKKHAPLTIEEVQNRGDYFRRDIQISVRASNPDFVSLDHPLTAESFGAADSFSSDLSADYEVL